MNKYLRNLEETLQFEPDPAFARRARIIFENCELTGKEKVLEVGCGRGFYLKNFKKIWPDLNLTGIDLNEKYLKVASGFISNSQVKLLQADVTSLPFKDDTFDLVIASEILEHIENDEQAIAEIFRVLKPKGVVLITVPNKNYPFFWDPPNWLLERIFKTHLPSKIWWLSGIWADHVRLYDKKELEKKLEREGFAIERVWFATSYCFPFSHFLFYGIGKNLVEKKFFGSLNRFGHSPKSSLFSKILLTPVKFVDSFNSDNAENLPSMNIICKARK